MYYTKYNQLKFTVDYFTMLIDNKVYIEMKEKPRLCFLIQCQATFIIINTWYRLIVMSKLVSLGLINYITTFRDNFKDVFYFNITSEVQRRQAF